MSQIIYPITHLPPVIDIGKQTEKGVTRIGFDVHEWLDDWPGMTFSVQPTRPGETESYFAASEMVGSVVFWLVGAVDTEKPGSGTVEVLGVTEDERKLSFMCRTSIANTNTATVAEVPEPNKPWVDQVLNAAKSVNEAAGRVEKSVRDLFIAHFDNNSYTLDKSYAEITDARLAGKSCVVVDSFGKVYTYVENRKVGNGYAYHFASAPYSGVSGKGVYGIMTEGINVGRNGECTTSRGVPAVTPNPRKLKLTGAVEAEYDGSDEVVVEIPDAGLPETADPLKQLVTDADGNVAWEDRLAYKTTAEAEVVNLEETALTYAEDDDGFYLLSPWAADLMVGDVATVTYNGTDYECKAVDGKAIQPDAQAKMVAMGNLAAMGMEGVEGGNPNAPFALVAIPNGDLTEGLYGMLIPLDGATTATLSVTSKQTRTTIKTIDPEYIGKKTITITVNDDGSYTSDTPFEEAWEMTPAELQSSIVINAKPDTYNGKRQYTVESVGKTEGNFAGMNGIQLRVMNEIPMDVSDSNMHDAVHYIGWTAGGISKVGTMPLLPRIAYAGNYLKYNGYTWVAVTIDQLKADLGLT